MTSEESLNDKQDRQQGINEHEAVEPLNLPFQEAGEPYSRESGSADA
jgi:hypothetical protein